jgi:hypothetical protein
MPFIATMTAVCAGPVLALEGYLGHFTAKVWHDADPHDAQATLCGFGYGADGTLALLSVLSISLDASTDPATARLQRIFPCVAAGSRVNHQVIDVITTAKIDLARPHDAAISATNANNLEVSGRSCAGAKLAANNYITTVQKSRVASACGAAGRPSERAQPQIILGLR